MKRISKGWVPVLCLLALCAACSSSPSTSEAELAIQQFYDRLGSEDYTAALNLYKSDVREALQISGGQVDQGYVEWAQEETKMGKVNGIEIVEESVDGDTADIQVFEDTAGVRVGDRVELTGQLLNLDPSQRLYQNETKPYELDTYAAFGEVYWQARQDLNPQSPALWADDLSVGPRGQLKIIQVGAQVEDS